MNAGAATMMEVPAPLVRGSAILWGLGAGLLFLAAAGFVRLTRSPASVAPSAAAPTRPIPSLLPSHLRKSEAAGRDAAVYATIRDLLAVFILLVALAVACSRS